jgi:hypothetical protein
LAEHRNRVQHPVPTFRDTCNAQSPVSVSMCPVVSDRRLPARPSFVVPWAQEYPQTERPNDHAFERRAPDLPFRRTTRFL